jgi:hypothetical protein
MKLTLYFAITVSMIFTGCDQISQECESKNDSAKQAAWRVDLGKWLLSESRNHADYPYPDGRLTNVS